MTVEELMDALAALPPQASLVFAQHDDADGEMQTADCRYERGNVYIEIHGGDYDDE